MNNGRLLLLVGTGVVSTLLWSYPAFLPIKLLAVLVHEMWHGLASMVAGASLVEIVIHSKEAGETVVRNLHSVTGFLVSVSAGYPGTTLTGALLLNRGLSGKGERISLGLFALLLAYMSYLFTAPGGLAFYTGLGWAFLLSLLLLPGRGTARAALIILGTVFVWYSIYDLFDFTGNIARTDAGILARYLTSRVFSPDSGVTVGRVAYLAVAGWLAVIGAILFLILRPVLHYSLPVPAKAGPDGKGITPAPSPAANGPAASSPALAVPVSPASGLPPSPAPGPAPAPSMEELILQKLLILEQLEKGGLDQGKGVPVKNGSGQNQSPA